MQKLEVVLKNIEVDIARAIRGRPDDIVVVGERGEEDAEEETHR